MNLSKPQLANSNRTVKFFEHGVVTLSAHSDMTVEGARFTLWLSYDDGDKSYTQQLNLTNEELELINILASNKSLDDAEKQALSEAISLLKQFRVLREGGSL